MVVPLLLGALLLPAQPLSDADGDGLPLIAEWALGTDPLRADTDGDGLLDGAEAVALLGSPVQPGVRLKQPGVRLLVWREGGEAWLLALTRVPSLSGLQLDAWPMGADAPRALEGLLAWGAPGPDGTRTGTLGFPAALLQASGGQLAFGLRAGAYAHEATLVERGAGWGLLERLGPTESRVLPAERAQVSPGAQISLVCTQHLTRLDGPFLVVHRELCDRRGDFCVGDCTWMLGHIVMFPVFPFRPR